MQVELPSIRDLLLIGEHRNPDATCFIVQVRDRAEPELAKRLAIHIAFELLQPSDTAFELWMSRFNGGPAHDYATKAELEAYVMSDFEPSRDPKRTRLLGAAVEHLWAALASILEGPWGRPLHVEHDHFSVIDHGPDGVTLYDLGHPDLRFRLWESKRHTGQQSVTSVITGAGDQLKANAAEYLARVSKPLQTHSDERVRVLAGRIVKLWTTNNDRSAVGVSVGRSSADNMPTRPLQGLVRAFGFSDQARCEGVIIEISDLVQFGQLLRYALIRGIN